MSIIRANVPGEEWIDAKAGENVIEKLGGYERLSWIRVVTEGPVGLTIKTLSGDNHRTTEKDPDYNCFATEKTARCRTRSSFGCERSARRVVCPAPFPPAPPPR